MSTVVRQLPPSKSRRAWGGGGVEEGSVRERTASESDTLATVVVRQLPPRESRRAWGGFVEEGDEKQIDMQEVLCRTPRIYHGHRHAVALHIHIHTPNTPSTPHPPWSSCSCGRARAACPSPWPSPAVR